MIHRVVSRKWRLDAPYILALCAILMSVGARFSRVDSAMQRTAYSIAARNAIDVPRLVQLEPCFVRVVNVRTVRPAQRPPRWLQSVYYEKPMNDLPRSAFSHARWNPLTDEITFHPFWEPQMWYFIGQTRVGSTQANILTAINSSAGRDIVEITAATTADYASATTSLPAKSGSDWILIQTQGWRTAPPVAQGTCVAGATGMATLRVTSASSGVSVFDYQPGAGRYYFLGLNFTRTASATAKTSALLRFSNPAGSGYGSVAAIPKYCVIDRCNLANPWTIGTQTKIPAGALMNGQYFTVRDTRGTGFWTDSDSAALKFYDCSGPGRVKNCYLQGSQNWFIGGSNPSTGLGQAVCIPHDILLQDLNLTKNTDQVAPNIANGGSKNYFESKGSIRICVDGFYGANHSGQGQGNDIGMKCGVLTAAGQGVVVNQDMTIRWGLLENGKAPPWISNKDSNGFNFFTPLGVSRMQFSHIAWRNPQATTNRIQVGTGCASAQGTKITDLIIDHLTCHGGQERWYWAQSDWTVAAGTMPGMVLRDSLFYTNGTASVCGATNGGSNVSAATAFGLDTVCGTGNHTVMCNTDVKSGTTALTRWGATLTDGSHRNDSVTAVAGLGFTNFAGGDLTLVAGSTYSGTGAKPDTTGAGDRGCNFAHLLVRQASIPS